VSTKAHDVTKYIADQWESYFASAVCSGIVGDAAHQQKNSYHNSLEDNPDQHGFSNSRPDDAAPPGTWPRNLAAAIDMSMSATDMALCCGRLWNVWNDTSDPRRVYINAFNGWFNEPNVPAKRYDFVSQAISETSSDHKWHCHLSIRRKWVESMEAASAILSSLFGQSKADFISQGFGSGGDDMFCSFGDKNDKVKAMQLQLLQLDPNCLPKFGADSGFGTETQVALSRLVTGGEPTYYGPDAWSLMQQLVAQKFGPSNGGSGGETIQWPLKGTFTFPGTTITIPPSTFEIDIVEQE